MKRKKIISPCACVLCNKVPAQREENILRGLNLVVCYEDLRDLGAMDWYYFPALNPKKPKIYNLNDWLDEVKKEISHKTMEDQKLKNTLLLLQQRFFKNNQKIFNKIFFGL